MQLKRFSLLFCLSICVGIGAAITLKVGIGVGAWDAMIQSLAFILGMKVGTLGMIINSSCIIGQIIILRKKFKKIQLLQVLVSIILGFVINFFLYTVFESIIINSYFINLALLIIAFIIIAFALSIIMLINLITFPLEGLCLALSDILPIKFSIIRQLIDVIAIIIVLILTFLFNLELTIREGTVIGMVIFGPLLGYFMNLMKPILKKHDFID